MKVYKAGFVGLVGQPNSGKSSLINFLVNEKVSIVNPKPQTTRRRILGVYSDEKMQAILVDAPGFIQAEKGLNGFLMKEAHSVISDSDALMAVLALDETDPKKIVEAINLVMSSQKPWIAVLHKSDLTQYEHRMSKIRDLIQVEGMKYHHENKLPVGILAVSSSQGKDEDRQDLLSLIEKVLPISEKPLYDSSLYTTENVRDVCSELLREQCFRELHQEVPFNLAVRVLKFSEENPICTRLEMEIVLAKEKHKPIVIGKKGAVLKKIGTQARTELEAFLQKKVYLGLNVKVSEDWQSNAKTMKEFGYVPRSE